MCEPDLARNAQLSTHHKRGVCQRLQVRLGNAQHLRKKHLRQQRLMFVGKGQPCINSELTRYQKITIASHMTPDLSLGCEGIFKACQGKSHHPGRHCHAQSTICVHNHEQNRVHSKQVQRGSLARRWAHCTRSPSKKAMVSRMYSSATRRSIWGFPCEVCSGGSSLMMPLGGKASSTAAAACRKAESHRLEQAAHLAWHAH